MIPDEIASPFAIKTRVNVNMIREAIMISTPDTLALRRLSHALMIDARMHIPSVNELYISLLTELFIMKVAISTIVKRMAEPTLNLNA